MRIVTLLETYLISFGSFENGEQLVLVGDVDATHPIRENEVTNNVSVSAIPEVKIVYLQQLIAAIQGNVMDGRDIGTVVLPDGEIENFSSCFS